MSQESLLEIADRQLREAQKAFAADPSDVNARRVSEARILVASEQERELQNCGPLLPSDVAES